jgi:DNA-directed RNA polymerase specialized sigma54-like protein
LNRLLQPRLNVKLSQRQVLTPGLVQMVGVLALTKLELKDMINGELVENPVLEEIDESSLTLDERSQQEGDRERSAETRSTLAATFRTILIRDIRPGTTSRSSTSLRSSTFYRSRGR